MAMENPNFIKLERTRMSNKAERGTKRTCQECEARFYDLNRDPIICPMCGVVFKVDEPEPEPKKAEPQLYSTFGFSQV